MRLEHAPVTIDDLAECRLVAAASSLEHCTVLYRGLHRRDHDPARVPVADGASKPANPLLAVRLSQSEGTVIHTVEGSCAGENLTVARSVLIVDDHSGFRQQARRLLESEGYLVVGEAVDCESAMTAARALSPDIALVDIYLPDGDGFELATKLVRLSPPPAVVLTSSHDDRELSSCLVSSPARGFVAKAELSSDTIEEVLA